MGTQIELRGVRVHNLQNIDVAIPLGQWTAVTGVSGAGKSSLVFDTLYAEAQRRYLQSLSIAIRQQLERFEQPQADSIGDLPPAIACRDLTGRTDGTSTVGTASEIDDYLRLLLIRAGTLFCPQCGQPVQPQRVVDVLAKIAAMQTGIQVTVAFPYQPDPEEEPASWAGRLRAQGFVRIVADGALVRLDEALPPTGITALRVIVDRLITGRAETSRWREALETAFAQGNGRLYFITDSGEKVFDQRWHCARCDFVVKEPEAGMLDLRDPRGACGACGGTGMVTAKKKESFAQSIHCAMCQGGGWSEFARSMRLGGKNIHDLSSCLQLSELAQFLAALPAQPDTEQVRQELMRRLDFLLESGLGHLTLRRPVSSLAAGERKRLRLAKVILSNLAGALYLVEEPSAGLHPLELPQVLKQLRRLVAAGNTVVTIDHHADVMRAADYLLDLGPGAGEEGGRIVAAGSIQDLVDAADSVTGEFLSGTSVIATPGRRRTPTGWLRLDSATWHNLCEISVRVPLGVLCAVTGVSGAGKRSLAVDILYHSLQRLKNKNPADNMPARARLQGASQVREVVLVEGGPLPRTARINPATSLKLFDEIRSLFAETTEAKIRGFDAGHFSFNQLQGRCEVCDGQGTLTVDMQFLADVTMTCPECHGSRYKKEILGVTVRSLNIADVLNLTVREAFRFFRAQRGVQRKLKWLIDVGLEYLRLGQPTETLSSGECQRLKLAGNLASMRKPGCLFILLEPSAGLHPADTQRLLDCLDGLVQTGHSVLVVENNLDVIQCADYVIDLGPGAGTAGGRIVAEGTPEEIAAAEGSTTGRHLGRKERHTM